MHLFNQKSLGACFNELDGQKAVGADGVSKAQVGNHLEGNLEGLMEPMKRMAYRPGPVREGLIPKVKISSKRLNRRSQRYPRQRQKSAYPS